MATKKDLIEAQGFSRRRLLSAFTGGAPGGKELDPAKPLRAVVAGVALTVGVILVGVFWGIMQPGLPGDWQNNRLIIATDTGARYVSVEGTLYPVINTASARLLIPAGEFKVVRTDQSALDGIPVGASIGILGAPDDLPAPSALINSSWTACIDDSTGTAVSLSDNPIAAASNGAGTVVQRGDELFVVADGLRHAVPADDANAVLRAVGLGTSDVYEVDGRWLNLFDPGADLEPIRLNAVGASVPGTDLTAGTIVHVQGSPADERYVALATGELARLSPLAYQLYLLGSGQEAGAEEEVSPAEVANVPTVPNAGGDDWPTLPLAPSPPVKRLAPSSRTTLAPCSVRRPPSSPKNGRASTSPSEAVRSCRCAARRTMRSAWPYWSTNQEPPTRSPEPSSKKARPRPRTTPSPSSGTPPPTSVACRTRGSSSSPPDRR